MSSWVFGYGSLIWRPDFEYEHAEPARLAGYERRFWQGSHDHRGTPHEPGRVVTLIESSAACDGMAFLIPSEVLDQTFEQLDHREKNGYERASVDIELRTGPVGGLTYIANPGNHAFLGDAPLAEIAEQVATCTGPSGRNSDYLFELAQALRSLDIIDQHVFQLEAAVKAFRAKRDPHALPRESVSEQAN